MPRSYATALLYGVAEFLTTLDLDGEPLASWTPGTWAGDPVSGVRPIVLAFSDNIPDEAWQLTASNPTPTSANGDVMTDVHLIYRGPKGGPALAALDVAYVVVDAFRPSGRPLSHHAFGAVRVGRVSYESFGPEGPDGNRRQFVSQTHRFHGKRNAVI